jgi:macrolide-specific efflux system membrane fusion protein
MTKKQIIGAVVVLLVVGGYYWYKSAHSTTTAIQYVTVSAEKGTLTTAVSGSGNVIVDQSVSIDPAISGTVTNVAVNIGDRVKKGQRLFGIDNDALSVSLAQALTSLQNARIAVSQAQANFSNAKRSLGDSERDRAILQSKIGTAEESLRAAELGYKKALSDSAKRQVTSPIDGTVNAINIKNGDDLGNLSSGNSRVVPMIIGDLGTLKTQVQINEVDVSNVHIGQKATMTFNGVSGLTLSGTVEKMDTLGTVAQGVVTYNATIGFDTLDPRIKSGMSVSASIITDVKQDVIIVPNSAVKTRGNKNYVDVLSSGTTPQQVTVQIGAVNNTDTEIVSGVSAGDKVVTRTVNPNATTTPSAGQGGALRIPGFGGGGGRGN